MSKELIVKWKIREPEIQRILALLPELASKTRSEPGNLSYAIYQAESDPGELVLYERYTDADAVEAHRKSEHYQKIVATGITPFLETREIIAVRTLI
jgi:quinol monooxygenase YgiN